MVSSGKTAEARAGRQGATGNTGLLNQYVFLLIFSLLFISIRAHYKHNIII